MDETRNISIAKSASGEKVALAAFEIQSIPSISIVNERGDLPEIVVEKYKAGIAACLVELFQGFKSISAANKDYIDVSYEILWVTSPVTNQPYNANIKLYVIVRSVHPSDSVAEHAVSSALKTLEMTLSLQKYTLKRIDYSHLAKTVSSIDDSEVFAVAKEERLDNLQNNLIPYCYSCAQIPPSQNDLRKIVGALAEYPNCAVSFQIIPTVLSSDERNQIDYLAQTLETLSNGIADQSIGTVSFALAKNSAAFYSYYSQRKNSPLFLYNILVYGTPAGAQYLSGVIAGQLVSRESNSVGFNAMRLPKKIANKEKNFFLLPWAVNEYLVYNCRSETIWSTNLVSSALKRLPALASSDEAVEFFRLPLGIDGVTVGIQVNESSKDFRTYRDNIINSGDIIVGKLASTPEATIGFSLKDLTKHMLVVGTPGSGKTTFSVGLLDRLWKNYGIPFLVIEPAKNEYRALVQSIPDLQVFTPGKSFISPFVFNPFLPPTGVRLETYKSTLKTAFAAGVSMTTPLDKIFEETINNCYSDFRWLDTYTSSDKGTVFNISDFIKCFKSTFGNIGYTGDAGNIGRAGVVRLNSFVNLFDNYHSIPIEDLLSKPTVIELAAIENSDEKALIISLLLLSILAYVNANYLGEGGLKNVILLEEAHVLLDADSNAGQGDANPSRVAQGLVKRMLAELRSYGVSMIIADQSPRKVSTDVIALTDMKVAFRLVEGADKTILGDSINMTEAQLQRLGKLKPGEAFLFFGKLDEPEEVITPDYRLENNIDITLTDEGIKGLSTYWNRRKELLRPYPECTLCECCRNSCDYDRRVLARDVARRLFVRNFKSSDTSFEPVQKVFGSISKMIELELNDEVLSSELRLCVKVHLWRRIQRETGIPVTDTQIKKSLTK